MSGPAGGVAARWRELRRELPEERLRITLLGTFTLDTLVPHLGVCAAGLGVPAEITVGPYHQIVQECLNPDSATSRSAPDVLVVWPRLEELWAVLPAPLTGPAEPYATPLHDVLDAARQAAQRLSARLVVMLPAIPAVRPLGAGDAANPHGVHATASAIREAARVRLADAGAVVCDAEECVRAVGAARAYDHRLAVLAGLPYRAGLLTEAGTALARAIKLALRPARKAVVVDADGTLWGGAVGELGADGIDLGPGAGEAYLTFQSYLLDLRRAGTMLALCSRNDEKDLWAAFGRPEMRVRREHLSSWRIGWDAKSAALAELAEELNIGVDALVFIDDNPVELAEVRAALPAVATVTLPADPVDWPDAVDDAAFDRLPPTEDDRARPRRMAEKRRREQHRRHVSPEQYLAGMDIQATLRPPASPADIRRLAQLILKTNQFVINDRRWSEQEVMEFAASSRHALRMVTVHDRFGDYGQVGAYILALGERSAELVTFLLSCRALGRGIEQVMLADAYAVAERCGHGRIVATVAETSRNEPARRFFSSVGCAEPGVPGVLERVVPPPYITVGEAVAASG